MSENKEQQPWVFGEICEGCGAPMLAFCPLCGSNLFLTGHGVAKLNQFAHKPAIAVCTYCVDRLQEGEEPPFTELAYVR